MSLPGILGVSRVIGNVSLPQRADRLDATGPARPGELEIDVDLLAIDSASWRQLIGTDGSTSTVIAQRIAQIVGETGRMKNPVTGSGGMLIGTVAARGEGRDSPPLGARVASLISLTATPLSLDSIVVEDLGSPIVQVKGTAFLPMSAPIALVPTDMNERMCLEVLDVCGAPAWLADIARGGDTVVVLGAGGRSGALCTAQALETVGQQGRVVAVCWPPESAIALQETGAEVITTDCTDPLTASSQVRMIAPDGADVVVVCTNVPDCESTAILSAARLGTILFFSMATSFTSAALTSESLGLPVRMLIGNGFRDGHADLALDLVRRTRWLQQLFDHSCALAGRDAK